VASSKFVIFLMSMSPFSWHFIDLLTLLTSNYPCHFLTFVPSSLYDPWATRLHNDNSEILFRYSGSVYKLRLLEPSCDGFLPSTFWCITDCTRIQWRDGVCGDHYSRSLLENCPPGPPPQALPPMDDACRSVPAMVEWYCCTFRTRRCHHENCRHGVHHVCIQGSGMSLSREEVNITLFHDFASLAGKCITTPLFRFWGVWTP